MSDWRVACGGDSGGGWLVDIHDGHYHAVYRPEAVDAEEAEVMARRMHAEAFHPANDTVSRDPVA